MRVYCASCSNEQYIDIATEGVVLHGFRCGNCGQVGTIKCAHDSCFDGYCEDCGEPEPTGELDPMDSETDL